MKYAGLTVTPEPQNMFGRAEARYYRKVSTADVAVKRNEWIGGS
jgi:hypothetical protein